MWVPAFLAAAAAARPLHQEPPAEPAPAPSPAPSALPAPAAAPTAPASVKVVVSSLIGADGELGVLAVGAGLRARAAELAACFPAGGDDVVLHGRVSSKGEISKLDLVSGDGSAVACLLALVPTIPATGAVPWTTKVGIEITPD